MLESSIGAAAHLQIFATLPTLVWGWEYFGPQILTSDLVASPLRFKDFHVHLPTGPGIGVTIDEAALRRFAGAEPMLYHVRMDVHPPLHMDPVTFDAIKAAEKHYAQDLQRSGKWVHLWRIVGEYSNISIFDATDNDELQAILSGLPLFPCMSVKVMPLTRHPSAIEQ